MLTSSSSSSRRFHPSFCISFSDVFYKAVPKQDMTNQLSRLSTECRILPSCLSLCHTSSFPTRSVQLFVSILFQHHILKLSRYFWSTVGSVPVSAPYKGTLHTQHFTGFFLKFTSNSVVKCLLLVEWCYCHGNPEFNFTCTSCIICYHANQTVVIVVSTRRQLNRRNTLDTYLAK